MLCLIHDFLVWHVMKTEIELSPWSQGSAWNKRSFRGKGSLLLTSLL
jgi:hypothetical protein